MPGEVSQALLLGLAFFIVVGDWLVGDDLVARFVLRSLAVGAAGILVFLLDVLLRRRRLRSERLRLRLHK